MWTIPVEVGADTVQHLSDGLIPAIPVIALAYFALRTDTVNLFPGSTRRRLIPIADSWKNKVGHLLIWVTHRYGFEEESLVFDARVHINADRNMLLNLTGGLLAAVAARVFTDYDTACRILAGIAIIFFGFAVSTLAIHVLQVSALHDEEATREPVDDQTEEGLQRREKERARPFWTLVFLSVVNLGLALGMTGLGIVVSFSRA